ncbi:MAG: helicase, partial [Peptococcaceae bacterium]|nr:helicase [Peptococcaceae bacterium]
AVLYADYELYDVRALVQMAGRTGRTAQNPEGRALFLAAKASKAMKEAVDWVRAQNNLAWEQGLLD